MYSFNENYRPFHKTLPKSSAFVSWISVRFYETDCIYLSLRTQVAVGTFFMKSSVVHLCKFDFRHGLFCASQPLPVLIFAIVGKFKKKKIQIARKGLYCLIFLGDFIKC